jgi:hypothetical protein
VFEVPSMNFVSVAMHVLRTMYAVAPLTMPVSQWNLSSAATQVQTNQGRQHVIHAHSYWLVALTPSQFTLTQRNAT